MITNVIQKFLGKIRVPKSFKLEGALLEDKQCYKLSYEAVHIDGKKVEGSKEYPGIYHTAQSVVDLVTWLRYTSQTFFGGGA